MKKIFYVSILFVAILASGCTDFLEETAYSKFSKEEAYSNPTLVYVNTVASVYTAMGLQGCAYDADFSAGAIQYLSEFSSDLNIIQGRRSDWVDGGQHQQIFIHTWTASHSSFDAAWTYIYQIIGLCNASIDDLQAMLDAGGEDFIQLYINELRAIRAYYYMNALSMFADVPVVKSSKTTVAEVGQSSRSEVYAFVRDELAEIIPTLSDASGVSTSSEYYGRMNKATGYMMMAKLAANAAVWSQDTWNDGKFTGGIDAVEPTVTALGKKQSITLDGTARNAWETVIYCQEKLASMGYALYPDDHENFLTKNQASTENIFIRPNNATNYQLRQRLMCYSLHSNHTKALANAAGSNGPAASVYAAELFGVKYDAATDVTDYSEADPRWDMFFYYGDISVNGKAVPMSSDYKNTLSYLPFAAKIDHGSPLAGSKEEYEMWCAGARVKKVQIDPSVDQFVWAFDYQEADVVVYRYADAVLLAAEAKYRMGDTSGALGLLNQIRNRVGAKPMSSIDAKAILDERGREFVWEPTRRDDLVRFGMYTEATTDKYVGVPTATGAGAWTYDSDGHTTVFPIPTSVLELNTNLKQNPGY
jgi:hypothetical protein